LGWLISHLPAPQLAPDVQADSDHGPVILGTDQRLGQIRFAAQDVAQVGHAPEQLGHSGLGLLGTAV
jgi:hypothetical protein